MKVEVIARHVGENAARESHVFDALERERVAADLHGDRARAGISHLGEHRVQLLGKRRRVRERPRALAQVGADRSDDPARHARCVRDRREHAGRRRLSVGSRNANDREPLRRIAVERGRDRRERATRALDANDGVRRHPQFAFHHDGGGARVNCLGNEVVSVNMLAAQRDEERARTNESGIDDDRVDARLRVPGERCARKALQQCRERDAPARHAHGRASVEGAGAIPSRSMAARAMRTKTGAATTLP